jgi:hypothetical protein
VSLTKFLASGSPPIRSDFAPLFRAHPRMAFSFTAIMPLSYSYGKPEPMTARTNDAGEKRHALAESQNHSFALLATAAFRRKGRRNAESKKRLEMAGLELLNATACVSGSRVHGDLTKAGRDWAGAPQQRDSDPRGGFAECRLTQSRDERPYYSPSIR